MEQRNVRNLLEYRSQLKNCGRNPLPPHSPDKSAPKPKLLEEVRNAIRTRHLSYNTEQAYVGWIRRYIFFHNKRHPNEMRELEIGNFCRVWRRTLMSRVNTKPGLKCSYFYVQGSLSPKDCFHR